MPCTAVAICKGSPSGKKQTATRRKRRGPRQPTAEDEPFITVLRCTHQGAFIIHPTSRVKSDGGGTGCARSACAQSAQKG
ncbi:hypothetical protein SKAU_G00385760 [Synaphobranchus kaupii]|uniref:Uncharacterized protein n=1 Tax=Synaphobranchus kaupii TaxID=118154 RepID=A0A9Q1EEK2_SYNKA|nr:hypothetical protein SKAU_G00385760 [Synaphobranchus kaupii]